MKKINITKRDIGFFFLGVLFLFIIETIVNWQDVKQGFRDGYNDAVNKDQSH